MIEETTFRIIIEFSLAVLAILLAVSLPGFGAGLFEQIEAAGGVLARRKTLAVLTVGLSAPLIRLAILPWVPVPEPAIHDEFSNLLAGETFVSGRLTNPTHPMWVHFETFYVDQKPTYMSMYPPAQGLVLALGRVFFGRPWYGVCLANGLMCAAMCWMFYGWLPPGWALLGGFLVVMRLGIFSYWMNSYYGGTLPALGGAVVLGALPRLMRRPGGPVAAILSAGLVILANTRPFEGFLIGISAAGALLIWSLKKHAPPARVLLARVIAPITLLLMAAALLMGYYNWRVFGSPLTMPYQVNRAAYAVAPYFTWQSPKPEPIYHHKVLKDFFVNVELSEFEKARTFAGFLDLFARRCLYLVLFYWTPMALVAGAMLGRVLWDRRVRLLVLTGCVFALGVLLNAYSAAHYISPATCIIYAIPLQAMRHLRVWRPGGEPVGLSLVRAIPAVCVLICVTQLFVIKPGPARGLPRANMQRQLESLPGRQLVIVRYSPDRNPNSSASVEWVYNAADINASRVVWAHDMGPAENTELVNYFKDRKAWLLTPDSNPVRLTEYTGP